MEARSKSINSAFDKQIIYIAMLGLIAFIVFLPSFSVADNNSISAPASANGGDIVSVSGCYSEGGNSGTAEEISVTGGCSGSAVTNSRTGGCGGRCLNDVQITMQNNTLQACTVQFHGYWRTCCSGKNNQDTDYRVIKIEQNIAWDYRPTASNVGADPIQLTGYAYNGIFTVATGRTIAFSSTYPSVCTVDGTGLVTSVSPGECEIVATLAGDADFLEFNDYLIWTVYPAPDSDNDTVNDYVDNCPSVPNALQENYDASEGSTLGDACNTRFDLDGDEIEDQYDNCPTKPNLLSENDTCDTDEDGVPDVTDNCPTVSNADQADNPTNGVGDACEIDTDNDGVYDFEDNCPNIANPNQENSDGQLTGDTSGDVCEEDSDNDGVLDDFLSEVDNCPLIPNPDQQDIDQNGIGDACEMTFADPTLLNADNDCLSWATACSDLNKAIQAAANRGLPQVFLKEGTYTPSGEIDLAAGVKLIGGFAGGETAATDANSSTNITTIAAGAYKGTLLKASNLTPLTFANRAELRGIIISGAELGPALYVVDAGVNLVNVEFVNNQYPDGAAIYAAGAKSVLNLNSVSFLNNQATTTSPVYLSNTDFMTLNSVFESNQGVNGAAIFATGSSEVTLDATQVNQNTASSNGAVYLNGNNATLKVYNSSFTDNQALNGAAIYFNGGHVLDIINTLIQNNHATNVAGAINLGGASSSLNASIRQSSIINNTAIKNAGAIAPIFGNRLLIENTTLVGNKAGVNKDGSASGQNSFGGALNVGGTAMDVTIRFSTLVDNLALGTNGGGAISMNNNATGSLSLKGNIIAGNTASQGSNILLRDVSGSAGITDEGYNLIGFNGISGVTPASAIDFSGSSFVSSAASLDTVLALTLTRSGGDGYNSPLPMLPITKDGPARNVIDKDFCSETTTDQRGEARPDAAKCDLGAYEFTELSCIDDAQRRQSEGEGLIKYCAPGFENIEISIGKTPLYMLVLLSLLGLGLMFRRQQ
ncbi:MAG: thrombospondin type 3 repeat-containing protein [Cellvibrionales bacterium]|nr:thrombospondin type 3 repeat-containing protein [Cellvibrionales bacterium]